MTLEEIIKELQRLHDNYRTMSVQLVRDTLEEMAEELKKQRLNLYL